MQELLVQKQSAAVKSNSLLQELVSWQQSAAGRSAAPPAPSSSEATVPALLKRCEILQSLIIQAGRCFDGKTKVCIHSLKS